MESDDDEDMEENDDGDQMGEDEDDSMEDGEDSYMDDEVYGQEARNEQPDEEEGSEFRVRIDNGRRATTQKRSQAHKQNPPNPNARVTRSAARKYSG